MAADTGPEPNALQVYERTARPAGNAPNIHPACGTTLQHNVLAIKGGRKPLSMHRRCGSSILRQLEVQLRQHEAALK